MSTTQSRITSQGQVTIPAEIRKRLGLAPGSVIEWREVGGEIVVARASKFSSEEIHRALFASPPAGRTVEAMEEGIRDRMRRKRARH
jgi:AbrB family looped-hinge helix DNA binding protein